MADDQKYNPLTDGPWDFDDPKFQPIAKAMRTELYDSVRDFAREETANIAHKLFELTDMEEADGLMAEKGAAISVALMMLRQCLYCLKAAEFPVDPTLAIIDKEHPEILKRITEFVLESQKIVDAETPKKKETSPTKADRSKPMTEEKEMTIDEMIAAIEQMVCIRKIWRANAGWGLFTIPLYAVVYHRQEMEEWYERRMKFGAAHPRFHGDPPIEPESIVQKYYPTLEECVKAEYKRLIGK